MDSLNTLERQLLAPELIRTINRNWQIRRYERKKHRSV